MKAIILTSQNMKNKTKFAALLNVALLIKTATAAKNG